MEAFALKRKILILMTSLLISISLTACGEENPVMKQFKKDINQFCDQISKIDTEINSINADSEDAPDELLEQLDQLDTLFQTFGEMDFPEEFDYLEEIADESSSYMTTAVENYHKAYGNYSYNEYVADYAKENYSRAYKRVQIILSFLHGETPDNVDLTMDDENADE